jgi:hypothetical protein
MSICGGTAPVLTWGVGLSLVSLCVQLFDKSTPYDDDDKDADRIYQAVDDRMDGRRKRRYAGPSFSMCTGRETLSIGHADAFSVGMTLLFCHCVARREAKLLETLKKMRADKPKAGDQFADLKADLKTVSTVRASLSPHFHMSAIFRHGMPIHRTSYSPMSTPQTHAHT